ncbi:MAG: hypothetical protein CMP40_00690 [Rickettsiales bacterium]|nr:hypothetical protein [Rickettsiales bacterium]
MIKQIHLVLTLARYFSNYSLIIFVTFIFMLNINNLYSQNVKNSEIIKNVNFPAAVIDMKKVLSKSTAFSALQKEIQNLEKNFKEELSKEEKGLKSEQEKLVAQKSVLSAEEFKEKENTFKQKVNKVQSKVEKIRRDLESAMARGMQIIQKEAVKHMKEIAAKNGYLMVFDANTTIIAADKINISNIVIDKLNKSLPKISIEKEN